MIYPIVAYGCKVLRQKAQEITKDYPQLNEIIDNMFETMRITNGVGLAAPQVNLSIRLIVIDADPYKEDEPSLKDFTVTIINPIITSKNEDFEPFNEGCLSLPGIREDIKRPTEITISYYDQNFEKHTKTFNGIAARIIQHEYDHLEGIVFTDYCSTLKKRLLKRKFNDILKGKVKTDYKMIFPK